MAAYVNVPKDLSLIKSKVAFNLTKRQLICFSIALLIGLPFYFFTKSSLGNTMAVLLMMVFMSPFVILAMFERYGQSAEYLLRNYIRTRYFWPTIRPYKTHNLYQYLMDLSEQEVKQIAKSSGTKKTSIRKHQTSRAK